MAASVVDRREGRSVQYQQRVIRGDIAPQHFVQLFDTQESRAAAVASFLRERADEGDHLLVAAKPEHWVNIGRELTSRGFDVVDAQKTRRLVFRDVFALLDDVSPDGEPQADAFDRGIGGLVRSLSDGAPLSVYGELVDVLAERNELDAAVTLEGLWNDLAEQSSITLMCGYCSAHFVSQTAERRLRQVCEAHGHVQTRPQDPLGRWLLKGARLEFRDDPSGNAA